MIKEKKAWNQIHAFMLRTSEPYPVLNALIEENKIIIIKKSKERNLYNFMCRIVVGQQLSTTAAKTLNERLDKLCRSENKSLSEIFYEESFNLIKTCGLSGNKIKAMIKLNEAFKEKKDKLKKVRKS